MERQGSRREIYLRTFGFFKKRERSFVFTSLDKNLEKPNNFEPPIKNLRSISDDTKTQLFDSCLFWLAFQDKFWLNWLVSL